jgi:hypothetical protein
MTIFTMGGGLQFLDHPICGTVGRGFLGFKRFPEAERKASVQRESYPRYFVSSRFGGLDGFHNV